jgi:hypothetical protein
MRLELGEPHIGLLCVLTTKQAITRSMPSAFALAVNLLVRNSVRGQAMDGG